MKEKDRLGRIITDLKLQEVGGATLGERLLSQGTKISVRVGGKITPLREMDVTADETLTLDPEVATMQDRRGRIEFERLRAAREFIPKPLEKYGVVGKQEKIKFGTKSFDSTFKEGKL